MSEQNHTNPLLAIKSEINKVYFIGIGGIGMSALARYFKSRKVDVSGYDRKETPLTKQLVSEGIKIHYNEDIKSISRDIDAVIYTPAIAETNKELIFCRENNFIVVKRSDVLQWITERTFNICVGGSHGKTTISTMIAHLLRDTKYGCNAFLGGVSANYNSNFWASEKNVSVIEADEYDRSFLKLSPDLAVITAMDADHLDIYGTAREVENAYIQFAQRVKPHGCLISKYGLKRGDELYADNHLTYSFEDKNADVFSVNRKIINGAYHFDISYQNQLIEGFTLNIGGLHNIENAVAAIAVAKYIAIEEEKIKTAIANFKGVKRRFEYYLNNDKHILIDDYAHHPQELSALINGIRSLFDGKLTVVFQPHLYSRTNDMAADFASSLDKADEVILLPIYPARELPMEGVSSDLILQRMKISNKRILSKEDLLKTISLENPRLMVLCGAGDIDELLLPIKEILEAKQ
ncbi:UDP-N-acetylmuramate--L-alanine ligase [Arachidicoccus sp.]|uniref:UDP-N-acetylmuramate--L-alanine ligase n=1 Tax=Arachidicoccus sp. TaxID=1872624 RepID=UPI003D24CC03